MAGYLAVHVRSFFHGQARKVESKALSERCLRRAHATNALTALMAWVRRFIGG